MAIEYTIAMDCSMPLRDLMMDLARRLSLTYESDTRLPTLIGTGCLCTAIPQSNVGQELISTRFGIHTTVKLICRIDKFDDHDMGMQVLVDLSLCLLSNFSFDMVLLGNGETGLLLRKSGSITVNGSDDYWKSVWKSAFARTRLSVEERSLPSL